MTIKIVSTFFLSIFMALFTLTVSAKDFKGAELSTNQRFLYGKIESSLYYSKVSGTVQAFWFWNKGTDPGVIWNEVDVEVFGKNNTITWGSNIIWELCAECQNLMDPLDLTEPASLADGWHQFTIEWTPTKLRWLLDGVLKREVTGGNALKINTPCEVVYNLWSSSDVNWVGQFDTAALPATMFADYVRVYAYDPQTGGFSATPVFEDNFDKFDTTKWRASSHSFDTNRVDFIPQNVGVVDGKLALALTTPTTIGLPKTAPKMIKPAVIDLTRSFAIQNASSKLYLEIQNGGTADGDNLVQNARMNASLQNWVFENASTGFYKIRNEASDKYVSLEGSIANGTKLGQWFYQGAAQEFSVGVEEGTDRFIIRPKNSKGPVLDVPDGLPVNGAQLQIWDDYGFDAQRFALQPVGVAKPPRVPAKQRIEAEAFSQMSGIQTENCRDVGAGLNVGWMDGGDWLKYSVTVATAGTYKLSLRVANQNAAKAQLRLSTAGSSIAVTVPVTGAWQNWIMVDTTLNLTAGINLITLDVVNGGFNLNYFDVNFGGITPPPIPIQAESFVAMSGVQTESTSDTGGGLNVGWIDAGDWLAWTVTIPTAGSYTVNMRVASPNIAAQFRLDKDAGKTTLATVTVPTTGGWQNWTTISTNVFLPAGTFNLGLYAFVGGFNVNWFEIVKN